VSGVVVVVLTKRWTDLDFVAVPAEFLFPCLHLGDHFGDGSGLAGTGTTGYVEAASSLIKDMLLPKGFDLLLLLFSGNHLLMLF